MNRQRFEQEEFTPSMYPAPMERVRPIIPVRADIPENEEPFLPELPIRQDLPTRGSEKTTDVDPHRSDCSCNYNQYATKKTIGQGFLEFALITSNAMQLKTLVMQKQRDGIWIASLILVCLSILTQLGLAYVLIVLARGDIRNPNKQNKLEKYNNLVLFLTILISVINVIINAFMSTTTSQSFLDTPLLEELKTSN